MRKYKDISGLLGYLVGLLVFAVVCNGIDCPPGWDHHGQSCYLFSKDTKSWQDAKDICESLSSSLVAIESQSEETFIAGRLHHEFASFMFWLGGTDQLEVNNTDWYWVMTEQLISTGYTDWHPTEPDHPGKQHCLAMRKDFQYKWTDDYCPEQHGYICESYGDNGAVIIG